MIARRAAKHSALMTLHDSSLSKKGLGEVMDGLWVQSFDLECYPCKHLPFSDKRKYNSTPEVPACFLQPLQICLLGVCHDNLIIQPFHVGINILYSEFH